MTDHSALIVESQGYVVDSEGMIRVPSDLLDRMEAALASVPALPTREQVADLILTEAIWLGREGPFVTSADRDDHHYLYCQRAADAILSLLTDSEED